MRSPRPRALLAAALLAALPLLPACGDDATEPPADACSIRSLPFSGSTAAPTVTDVALELQPGEGVVVAATATHPSGDAGLLDVTQRVGVFPDPQCLGAPFVVEDDLAGSGVEETFGTAVDAGASPAVYAAIEAQAAWPVEVDFADVDGNRTTGHVMARVVR